MSDQPTASPNGPTGPASGDGAHGLVFRFADAAARRLDKMFKPYVGGAQLGGETVSEVPRRDSLCDICGQPYSQHRFGGGSEGRMYCPTPGSTEAAPTAQS